MLACSPTLSCRLAPNANAVAVRPRQQTAWCSMILGGGNNNKGGVGGLFSSFSSSPRKASSPVPAAPKIRNQPKPFFVR